MNSRSSGRRWLGSPSGGSRASGSRRRSTGVRRALIAASTSATNTTPASAIVSSRTVHEPTWAIGLKVNSTTAIDGGSTTRAVYRPGWARPEREPVAGRGTATGASGVRVVMLTLRNPLRRFAAVVLVALTLAACTAGPGAPGGSASANPSGQRRGAVARPREPPGPAPLPGQRVGYWGGARRDPPGRDRRRREADRRRPVRDHRDLSRTRDLAERRARMPRARR